MGVVLTTAEYREISVYSSTAVGTEAYAKRLQDSQCTSGTSQGTFSERQSATSVLLELRSLWVERKKQQMGNKGNPQLSGHYSVLNWK